MLTKWSVNAQPCVHFSQFYQEHCWESSLLACAWDRQSSMSLWAAGSMSKVLVATITQVFLLIKYKTFW